MRALILVGIRPSGLTTARAWRGRPVPRCRDACPVAQPRRHGTRRWWPPDAPVDPLAVPNITSTNLDSEQMLVRVHLGKGVQGLLRAVDGTPTPLPPATIETFLLMRASAAHVERLPMGSSDDLDIDAPGVGARGRESHARAWLELHRRFQRQLPHPRRSPGRRRVR